MAIPPSPYPFTWLYICMARAYLHGSCLLSSWPYLGLCQQSQGPLRLHPLPPLHFAFLPCCPGMTAPSLWAAKVTPTGSPCQKVSHTPSSPSTSARIRAGVALLGTSCTGRRRHERLLRPQLPHDPMCPQPSQRRYEGQEQEGRGGDSCSSYSRTALPLYLLPSQWRCEGQQQMEPGGRLNQDSDPRGTGRRTKPLG